EGVAAVFLGVGEDAGEVRSDVGVSGGVELLAGGADVLVPPRELQEGARGAAVDGGVPVLLAGGGDRERLGAAELAAADVIGVGGEEAGEVHGRSSPGAGSPNSAARSSPSGPEGASRAGRIAWPPCSRTVARYASSKAARCLSDW